MKILIADDNSDDREVLRIVIERHGHEVIEAGDGREGLDMAAAHRPDLIISDALMPVMDGFQFLRQIKKDEALRTIPFIFYSATYKGQLDMQLAMSLGAEAYIIKPKDPVKMWEEVERIIKEGKQEKAVTAELIEGDEEYMNRYSQVVAAKLEEKVRDLEKSEKKLRDITASLGEGIYVLDMQGRITFINPMAEQLLGWTMEELNEKGAHNLIHSHRTNGSSLPFEECNMHKVIKTGKPYISKDEVFMRKDGSLLPISVISSPIIEDGEIVASVTAFRDFTERKRLEKEKEMLIHDLQEAIAKVKTLSGMLPICATCKKIRDDKGYWNRIETYISEHADVLFSHGICPDCEKKAYKDLDRFKKEQGL